MHASTLNTRAPMRADHLNLALWTFQGWVALFFIAAAYAKLTQPIGDVVELFSWTAAVSGPAVRSVGLVELAMAIGVLAPLALGKLGRPFVIASAAGLLSIEAVMLIVHLIGGEAAPAVTNLLLVAVTAPIVWFRSRGA